MRGHGRDRAADAGDAALGNAAEGGEAGREAGFSWDAHISDSRLALGREGFRFSGLEVIEMMRKRKLKGA
jgi:hypothetical protein